MDLYNQYIRQYLDLEQMGGFKNVIVTPYEDVVLTPEVILERFANATGWPLPKRGFVVPGQSAKGEASHGRKEALQKLRSRHFLSQFKDHELRMICEGLDKKLIERFSEGTHSPTPRPYTQDCETE